MAHSTPEHTRANEVMEHREKQVFTACTDIVRAGNSAAGELWQAITLSKTVPSASVAKSILDDLIEANKAYWPELK